MWCCAWQLEFLKEKKIAPNMGQTYDFLNLLENLVISFFLNLVYKESLYCLLYSCTNPILGKNLIPEIWTKMLSKWPESLILCTLIQIHWNKKCIGKYLGGLSQEWMWSLWSQDNKIGCISRINGVFICW